MAATGPILNWYLATPWIKKNGRNGIGSESPPRSKNRLDAGKTDEQTRHLISLRLLFTKERHHHKQGHQWSDGVDDPCQYGCDLGFRQGNVWGEPCSIFHPATIVR